MIPHQGVADEKRIELYKVTVAVSDITAALFLTRMFLKQVRTMKDEGYMALQDGIIIAYGRPFRHNRPYGALDSKWEQFPFDKMQDLHRRILDTRDKVVAHSDLEHSKVQIIPPGCSIIPGTPNEELGVQLATILFPIEIFPAIEQLCLFMGGKLNSERERLLEETYGKIKLPTVPFDLI